MKKGLKRVLYNIPSMIYLLVLVITMVAIIYFGVLPTKYLTLLVIAELVFYILSVILYNLKNKVLKIIGIILLIIGILSNCIAYYYISNTNSYLTKNFEVESYKVKTTYYLIGSNSNTYTSLDDLKQDDKVYYYKFSQSVNKALEKVKYNKPIETIELYGAITSIYSENSMLLVSKADFDYLMDATSELSRENYKIICEFEVVEYFKINNDLPESYNVYINGLDFSGNRRDFNMIATINTKTHKVVLTSIPRDYYMYVPALGMNDSLTGLGLVDSQVAKEALENLFDIKIDYTLNLYTESLVKVVDTIGGVEYCSDKDFYTTHDLTIGSYADKGEKLLVKNGCHTYNGIEILTIARERVNISNRGDRGRMDTDRQIIVNILKKLATVDTIKNYKAVLNSLDGTYTSNINKRTIIDLIKESIDNPKYEIIEQSVDGKDTIAPCRQGTGMLWALEPNMDTVNNASNKIKEVINEK